MSKVYSYLGLARRAGKIVTGEGAVENSVRRGQVLFLLIAEDASANTYRKFSSLAQNHNVSFLVYGEKDLFGQAIGQSPRAVLGVTDRNFANVIRDQVKGSVQEKN
ncbi:MAG: ribosomal L7Ae/L30e/S12e/Gadd45 family protein [Bacillota bacterium]|jgi:ribosomal protein L7Ae-like RNA K-turn-binding protein|nr:ribosomal L7Ae/L30e/S12e/Gadd45 family protein [Bacillota bacterium]NLJ03268.1 50S ribosomal protein L7ae [Bacillota bacterium]